MFRFPQQMKRVFKDLSLQQQFEKNGFVVLPFYNASEISYLLELYRKLHPVDEKGFFPSTFSKDKNYRKRVDEEIQRTGKRSIDEYFIDIQVVGGSFIVKAPGPESVMEVHQDMTLLDESVYTAINIWCPLVDLTPHNGVLYVLPESHRIYPTYRGASIPNIYENVYQEIKQYMVPQYLKAGEAIVFDQSIIHYSPPNLSDSIRPVTNIFITHKDAVFRTAYYDKVNHPNEIELFEQDRNIITDYEQFGENIYDRPKVGKSLGYVPWNFPKLTAEFLEQKYGKKKKKSMVDKILSVFK
jgi:hypothetical protein